MISLIEQFLSRNNHSQFNKQDLELQLKSHPQFPSFKSITDTLDYFGIENLAAKVTNEALALLPKTFLTLIYNDDHTEELVLVTKKDNGQLIIKREDSKRASYKTEDFFKIWTKTILAVEPSIKTNKKNYSLVLSVTVLVASIIGMFALNKPNIIDISLFGLSLLGLGVSYLLLQEKLGNRSATISKFCNLSAITNCDDVINSQGSKILGKLELTDVNVLFFSSVVVYQLFFSWSNILTVIMLLSVPVVLYAIYYQAFKVKKLCTLCLITSLTLLGLATMATTTIGSFELMIISTLNLLVVSGLLSLLFYYIKGILTQNATLEEHNIGLQKFKKNPEIFNFLMSSAEHIENTTSIPNEIILGNPEAKFTVIGLTNPMCGYCKDAFANYTRLVNAYGDRIKLSLRFNTGADAIDQDHVKVSARLQELYLEHGAKEFIDIYNAWFKNRNTASWLKTYGEPSYNTETKNVLNTQKQWSQDMALSYTPATVVGNTVLPKAYSYSDLNYIVAELLIQEEQSNIIKVA